MPQNVISIVGILPSKDVAIIQAIIGIDIIKSKYDLLVFPHFRIIVIFGTVIYLEMYVYEEIYRTNI